MSNVLHKLIVLTSPSGAGKTTITRHLLDKFPFLAFSVSATTRHQREGEVEGLNYYFIDPDTFRKKIEAGDFLEWEEVYRGLLYGTLVSEIERISGLGKITILDIDVNGALNIKELYGDNVYTIFIKPPSIEVLIERLKKRGTENEEEINMRVERMKFELSSEKHFDVVIYNDDLETALREAEKLVLAFATAAKTF